MSKQAETGFKQYVSVSFCYPIVFGSMWMSGKVRDFYFAEKLAQSHKFAAKMPMVVEK